jgi:hypothetical protein
MYICKLTIQVLSTLTLCSKFGSLQPNKGAKDTVMEMHQIMTIMVPMVRKVLEWM